MKQNEVSRATMGRIPVYLRYLREHTRPGGNISATTLAQQLHLGEVQVRKDLNAISGAGRPRTGYDTRELIAALERYLGCGERGGVVIVGAGKLGRALLDYRGFGDYGLEILAAFDAAVEDAPRQSNSGKPIYPMRELSGFCARNAVRIGIITVPAGAAQQVAEQLVASGVRGIWCFAPCTLCVPDDIPVQYENMALSLAYLSNRIRTGEAGQG